MAEKLETRAAVFIIMRNSDGEVLLQQRANTGYLDGYYDFACSGHVDKGESIHETAIRELFEEVGVKAQPEDLKLVHINQNFIDTPYINFTFILDTWQGIPTICEPEKCSDLKFFATDNLPKLCTLNVRLNEQQSFAQELSYSKVTPKEFAKLMKDEFSK
jgi:8-oxo-dGTP pyrophosphatase MutT (NUDIX family)